MSQESEFSDLFHQVFMLFHRRRSNTEIVLSAESASILEHLDRAGPLTVMEAASHFQRSQSSVSEIISRLERRDLVKRYADSRDRRRNLVWLTTTGLDCLREARRVLDEELVADVFRSIGEDRTKNLISALRVLVSPDTPPTEGESE